MQIKTSGWLMGILFYLCLANALQAAPDAKPADADNFYKSDKLAMRPVTFPNQYKMEMSGDLFVPKDMEKGKK